jgi:hypothetical protein
VKASLLAALPFLFLMGCASTSFQADPVPAPLRASGQRYFVENHGNDDRHLERMIAAELGKQGVAATSGAAAGRPADIEVLVVYEDRWQWDLSNYLIHMRIDLRDPRTNVLLATGSSYQTSLARKDEQKVIAEIVTGMFQTK